MPQTKEKERIRELCKRLYKASTKIRILRSISWPLEVRDKFFLNKEKELPVVTYPTFDPSQTLDQIKHARKLIFGKGEVDTWAEQIAYKLENSAFMLSACGTHDFFKYSSRLYGTPMEVLPDGNSTSYSLAIAFEEMYNGVENLDIGGAPDACISADTVAREMEIAVTKMFGDERPEVELVDLLSSNAIAGSKRIRVRKGACFTDKDINQLILHEAYIHVATSHNGFAQEDLKILRAGHPGTTKTQEGLAVFAEFITGSIDLDRIRRLSDRILAVQMAIDGADFFDIYHFFHTKVDTKEQAFENARRVFRGGVLTGRAPFTKDIVYLDGLLRVHNFLRIAVSAGRADLLHLLFCGKLDLSYVPVLCHFADLGLLKAPRFLPPWIKDLRFLLAYLSYSSFLNSINLTESRNYYKKIIAGVPHLNWA